MKSKLAASCGHYSPSKGISPPALMPPSVSITQDPGSACSDIEPPVSISWKPKRGSIKLPNIDLDALGKLRTSSDVLHDTTTTTTHQNDTLDTKLQDVDQGPATSSNLPD